MLHISELSCGYGNLTVVNAVSLEVNPLEIVAVLGNNGAGKSTLLRTISGLLRPTRGEIYWEGERIDRLPPHQILRRGLAHVPEERRIFSDLTVEENLKIGALFSPSASVLKITIDQIYSDFPLLAARRKQLGNTLSGGEQQILAICRGLMSKPKCLLLDEPSLGLSPLKAQEVFGAIHKIRERGVTILLVEQNCFAALALADRGVVLETGRLALSGSAAALSENPHVQRTYLGLGDVNQVELPK